ncbi:MAG: LysR substrate-binding domain-containing protein [Pseudohongiellaceae bacterium]
MTPSIRQLRYLCAVAEHRHFSKAAEACHVAQSTLSAAIHELESRLGIMIFERNRKTVLITPLGERLIAQALRILGETEDFVSLAKSHNEVLSGEIRLGVIPTIGPFLLPTVLSDLRKQFPRLRLYLKEMLSAELARQLLQGELDLIVLAFPYPLPEAKTTKLFTDQFQLCLPPGHRLTKANQVKHQQLRGEKLLLLEEGHCLRDHALKACKLEQKDTELVYQGTSLHTLVQMAANGLGMTLLPQIAINAGILGDTKLQLRPFQNENVSREIGMAWRKSDPRQDEYLLLAKFIRERAANSHNKRARR